MTDALLVPGSRPRRRPKLPRVRVRADISRRHYSFIAATTLISLLFLWVGVVAGTDVSPVFLPGPQDVWGALVELWQGGELWLDLGYSNLRVLSGFLLALVVSIPLGMLVGNLRSFEAAVEPLLGFVRYMPVPAFIPLLILYTGIGETPKILVIFIGTAVQMVLMVADVTRRVPADYIRAAIALGANARETFLRVIWPASLPGIFDVIRLNLGWAWTYLIVAELVAANEGLGFRILKAQRFLNTDTIFLYLLLIGCLGIASDLIVRAIQRRMFAWSEQKVTR
ncbi:MAG: nitrate transport permease nrtB [Rhodospirillaceae bacterium]|nr:nitrate transport permease nrtB [Rhodospirillaceae bacterium]|tara:strand:+ start:138 stop:983 length:846 start_codon:yes stop_codon:yes gene_type:complete